MLYVVLKEEKNMNKSTATFDVLERIRELRKIHGDMSVYELSSRTGIPQSTISTWYSKNYYPPIDKIEAICKEFNISLEEFFHENTDSENPITLEDLHFLKKWHRLSAYQKNLIDNLASELQNNLTDK